MIYTFLVAARKDLHEAVSFYESRRPGLGAELAAEVRAALTKIVDNPLAWPRVSGSIRRCRLQRFPYALIYQPLEDRIRILAVAHVRRHPDAWKKRR